MSVIPGPLSFMHNVGTSLSRIVEAPGAWLTSFVDRAEEVWASDPLLSDEDERPLA